MKLKDVKTLFSPEKSPSDHNEYRLIKLQNDLKVLLVKKPRNEKVLSDGIVLKDKKAAVSLCISVGTFDDPPEAQGLNRLLQKIILCEPKKLPIENDFESFLHFRGGSMAITNDCEHSTFSFEIYENHFEKALDRFSFFFLTQPLQVESLREQQEILEYEFSHPNDASEKIRKMFASMIQDGHLATSSNWRYSRIFSRRADLSWAVDDFREGYYTATRMNLCIQSTHDFDDMTRMAHEYFGKIRRGNSASWKKAPIEPFENVFKPDFYEKMYLVRSDTKQKRLMMTFLLPTMECDPINTSLEYLSFLFNHQGSNSLLSFFKRKRLATNLQVKFGEKNFEGNSMFTLFTIEVLMTRDGLYGLENVLDAIFSYLCLIRSTPLVQHEIIYEEFKAIKNNLFDYKTRKSDIENVHDIALNMKYFDDEDILIGNEVCSEFDGSFLQKLIELINEKKFNLMIYCDKYKKGEKIELWHETDYTTIDLPEKIHQLWDNRSVRGDFSLPWNNQFICQNFSIYSEADDDDQPVMNDFCKCFFKVDEQFKLPHGFIFFHFWSTLTESSVTSLNLTGIYALCLQELVFEHLYPAVATGFKILISHVDDGLMIKLSGFSEKLPLIMELILKSMRKTGEVVTKSIFETCRKKLIQNINGNIEDHNFLLENLRLSSIKPNHKFVYDRVNDIENIQFVQLQEFSRKFIKSSKVKVLIQGNFSKRHSIDLTRNIIDNLKAERLDLKMKRPRAFHIPIGATYLRVKSPKSTNSTTVVRNYYQIGPSKTESDCMTELLARTIRNPLKDFLVNREGICRAVECWSAKDENMVGLIINVEFEEGETTAWTVDNKIESFLKDFLPALCNMKQKDFEILKQGIIDLKSSSEINLESEVERNWKEIRESKYQFDRIYTEAGYMEHIERSEFEFFFIRYFSPENARKLSTQIIGNIATGYNSSHIIEPLVLELMGDDQLNCIKNISQFKANLAMLQL